MVDKWPLLLFVCSKIRHLFVLMINTVLNNIRSILHRHSKKRNSWGRWTEDFTGILYHEKESSSFFSSCLRVQGGVGGGPKVKTLATAVLD